MTERVRKYRYSEIFGRTFQGEGHYTGVPTVWIRFWGCNFNCNGFGQENPENPETYILDYENLDPAQYKSMEELPVFHRGCDSSYSWAKKFAHLSKQKTASEICDEIESLLPGGKFQHPESKQWHHFAFTGGEPMMSQTAIVDIMEEFARRDNIPRYVTIETNGTQMPRQAFVNMVNTYFPSVEERNRRIIAGETDVKSELFWSVSPKLYLSGEKWDNAIKPDVVSQYFSLSRHGQLKYVCNGSNRNWEEVKKATEVYRDAGVEWDVWIMPVGADKEMQESHQARITEEAIERGYNVALRVHTWCFGNVVGK